MYEWTHCAKDSQQDACIAPFGHDMIDAGVTNGLAQGSWVMTGQGPCDVENLRPGDQVMTVDSGLQTIRSIEKHILWSGFGECPRDLWPLHVPAGVIGNQSAMVLLPGQAVRLPGGMCGFDALVPALALTLLPSVKRIPPFVDVEVVRPIFDRDQLVGTDGGALLYCPSNWSPLRNLLSEDEAEYRIAGNRQAGELVELAMEASPFADRPITFPLDLKPGIPGNQDNRPVQTRIA